MRIEEIEVLIVGQERRVKFYYGHAAGIAVFGLAILLLNNILFFKDNEEKNSRKHHGRIYFRPQFISN